MNAQVLLVSNKFDYTTDHVVTILEQRGIPFLRLNRDCLNESEIIFQLEPPSLLVQNSAGRFSVQTDSLEGIYFRAPVFLRDGNTSMLDPDGQLSRYQWAAFVRALSVFDKCVWVNPPWATYLAEIKPVQLRYAAALGFHIPKTIVTNCAASAISFVEGELLAVKTLDSAVLRIDDANEAFIYTNVVSKRDFAAADISTAPITVQEVLSPKTDVRVTVVGKKAFSAAIVDRDGSGVDGDWRLQKDDLSFVSHDLPIEIEQQCIELAAALGLNFAGIDLAIVDSDYVFIELNPTGEWAWLAANCDFPIASTLCELLTPTRGGDS